MQWFKSYFDRVTNNGVITDYDGEARRATSKTGAAKGAGSGGPRKIPTSPNPAHTPAAAAVASSVAARAEPVPTSAPSQAPASRRAPSTTTTAYASKAPAVPDVSPTSLLSCIDAYQTAKIVPD